MNQNNGVYIASNTIGIIIALSILADMFINKISSKRFDDAVFKIMLYANIGLMATDLLFYIVDGAQFPCARLLNIVNVLINHLLFPVICLSWLVYCEYKLTKNENKIKRKLPVYIIPALLSSFIVLRSCFMPSAFWVNEQNIYARGPYSYPFTALCLLYPFYAFILTIKAIRVDKKGRMKEINQTLLLYPIIPVIAALFQVTFFGVTITWIGAIIAIMILYFNLQNTRITTDALTSLNNRWRYESYIESKIRDQRKYPILFLLIIDIDFLKTINDQYGHVAGDAVIKNTADILTKAVPWSDFIARIGGDEFVVIGEREDKRSVLDTIESIRKEIAEFNQSSNAVYPLSLSIGYGLLNEGENKRAEDLLAEADLIMYQDKRLSHANQNREAK